MSHQHIIDQKVILIDVNLRVPLGQTMASDCPEKREKLISFST